MIDDEDLEPERVELNMEIIVSEEDGAVYVKFTGFLDEEDAENYAEHLHETLPLMLFDSKVLH